MDNFFLVKFRKTFFLLSIVICLCLILILLTAVAGYVKNRISAQAVRLEEKLQQYKKDYGAGHDDAVKKMESMDSELKKTLYDFTSLFRSKIPSNALSLAPLSFKQYLFDTQDKLKKESESRKIILPQVLGFEEYMLKVPQLSQIPSLVKKLFIMEEIIKLLFVNKVFNILTIKFVDMTDIAPGKLENKEVLFKAVSLNLSIKTQFNNLNKFLEDLSKKASVYIVKKLDIKQEGACEGSLLVDMELTYMEI